MFLTLLAHFFDLQRCGCFYGIIIKRLFLGVAAPMVWVVIIFSVSLKSRDVVNILGNFFSSINHILA